VPTVVSVLALVVFVGAICFRNYQRRKVFVIHSPRFGILNLKGELANSIVSLDMEVLGPVLGQPQQSSADPPLCDVLFLYCDIGLNGDIENYSGNLRDVIQTSGAKVVVVASENRGEAYIASIKAKTHGLANLVMTIARKEAAFPKFFSRLFEDMKKGVSMPMAWVKLAPQGPVKEHANLPEMFFVCEAGQMVFK
jgi:hypothetical protein